MLKRILFLVLLTIASSASAQPWPSPVGIQLVTGSGAEDTLFRTARWVWRVLH